MLGQTEFLQKLRDVVSYATLCISILPACVTGRSDLGAAGSKYEECKNGNSDACYELTAGVEDPNLCTSSLDTDSTFYELQCGALTHKARSEAKNLALGAFVALCEKDIDSCKAHIATRLGGCHGGAGQAKICLVSGMIREIPETVAKDRAQEIKKQREEKLAAEEQARREAQAEAAKKAELFKSEKGRCYEDRTPQSCINAANLAPSDKEYVKLLDFGISLNSGMAAASAYYGLSREGTIKKFPRYGFYLAKIKSLLIPECEAMGGDYCKVVGIISDICDPSNRDCKEIQLKNAVIVAELKRQEEKRLVEEKLRQVQEEREAREERYRREEANARRRELQEMREERRQRENLETWKAISGSVQKSFQQPTYQQPTYQLPKTTYCNTTAYGDRYSTTCNDY